MLTADQFLTLRIGMKTLLLLGAGIEQIPAIECARRKNIRTVVFDKNPDACGKQFSDEFYPISTRDIDEMLSFLKKYQKKIDGVITIASDIPHCVSAVAEFLHSKCISKQVADVCVDKLREKEVLKKSGVNVPDFTKIETVDNLRSFINKIGFPVVLKPVDNSGARGVLMITRDIDLNWAFNYSKGFSYSGILIAEKFLQGLQISTEGIMYRGKFYITGFADRNYSKIEETKPFIVEDGGDMPTSLGECEKKLINNEFEKATRALGINWGPSKGDMVFCNDGCAYAIEIAARLSGGNFCYDTVPLTTGVNIVDILIDMAVGNVVDTNKFIPTKNLADSQRYFFPKPGKIIRIDGLEKIKRMENIYKVDMWSKVGDVVPQAANHPSRVGYLIAVGQTREEAIYWAQKGIETVKIVTE